VNEQLHIPCKSFAICICEVGIMKRIVAVIMMVLAIVAGGAQAQAQSSLTQKAPTGRCQFPSSRALGLIISQEAKNLYLKQGYPQALVTTRVVVKKPVVTALSKGSVAGLGGISITPSNPLAVKISANAGGAPIELGCNAEAEITTMVTLTDAYGFRTTGRSVSKVIVQGAFN